MTIPLPDDDARRRRFIRNALLALALTDAHRRGRVFAERVANDDPGRRELRRDLRRRLIVLADDYSREDGVSEADHVASIQSLADELTNNHGGVLRGGQYRLGTAQKVLNVWLKYLWCVGWLPEPPHCPFDREIIALLPNVPIGCRNWTEVNDLDCYRHWVSEARTAAGELSLPRWELRVWGRG